MQETQRLTVHPYYFKQYNNRWFLTCSTGEWTNLSIYALDRIESVKPASVTFRDTGIGFGEYFRDIIGGSRDEWQKPERVLLRFESSEYCYVETKPWHEGQHKVGVDEKRVTVELRVILNFETEQKILFWGEHVEVLATLALREKIRSRISKSLSLRW